MIVISWKFSMADANATDLKDRKFESGRDLKSDKNVFSMTAWSCGIVSSCGVMGRDIESCQGLPGYLMVALFDA
jgi:hypothetical protein